MEIRNQKRELKSKYPETRVIIVSVGYASAEVEERLNEIVDHYLVYQHQSFTEDFGTVLNSLRVNGKASKGPAPEIESAASDSLQLLLAAREKEISDLNERLKLLSEQQKAEALPRQQEWRAWLRADQEKWEKRVAELDEKAQQERTQLQEAGERTRFRKFAIATAILTPLSLFAVLFIPYSLALTLTRTVQYRGYSYDVYYPNFYKTFFSLLAVFVVIPLLLYYFAIHSRFLPLGFKTSEIGKYTGDLSQLILRARTTSISSRAARLCLKNSNPIIRYFGALVFLAKGRDDVITARSPDVAPERTSIGFSVRWSRLAAIEGWKPLYLAYLKMAFRVEDVDSIQKLFDLLLEANADDPRIVYLISTMPEPQNGSLHFRVTGLNAASPAYGRVLAHALFERTLVEESDWWRTPAARGPFAQFAQAFAHGVPQHSRQIFDLAVWFKEHGQFWHRDLKETVQLDLSEQELVSMIEALSPHREWGLAAFRDLPISSLYLRLYRFFSEIHWRFEQGDVILKQ
jgi:hypothetical protein